MNVKYLIPFTLILFFGANVLATNPIHNRIGNETNKKEFLVKEKSKKQGLFKKVMQKMILKKLTKLQEQNGNAQLDKQSKVGLGLGITSFVIFLFGIANPWLFLVAGLLAIAGDVICIRILRSTAYDKNGFVKLRRRAKAGLAFALLTGIVPLVALLLTLLAFA